MGMTGYADTCSVFEACAGDVRKQLDSSLLCFSVLCPPFAVG